jgi:hypothetical protein
VCVRACFFVVSMKKLEVNEKKCDIEVRTGQVTVLYSLNRCFLHNLILVVSLFVKGFI